MHDVDVALRLEINRDCRLAAFSGAAGDIELQKHLVERAAQNAQAMGRGGPPTVCALPPVN